MWNCTYYLLENRLKRIVGVEFLSLYFILLIAIHEYKITDSGSDYTPWGRTPCTVANTELVYSSYENLLIVRGDNSFDIKFCKI